MIVIHVLKAGFHNLQRRVIGSRPSIAHLFENFEIWGMGDSEAKGAICYEDFVQQSTICRGLVARFEVLSAYLERQSESWEEAVISRSRSSFVLVNGLYRVLAENCV